MLGREFSARGGEVKHVDRRLTFGIDQRDVDVAVLLGEDRADPVQQAGLILRNDLNQRAVRGARIVKLNLRRLGALAGPSFSASRRSRKMRFMSCFPERAS